MSNGVVPKNYIAGPHTTVIGTIRHTAVPASKTLDGLTTAEGSRIIVHIDIVILNAGIFSPPPSKTHPRWEPRISCTVAMSTLPAPFAYSRQFYHCWRDERCRNSRQGLRASRRWREWNMSRSQSARVAPRRLHQVLGRQGFIVRIKVWSPLRSTQVTDLRMLGKCGDRADLLRDENSRANRRG